MTGLALWLLAGGLALALARMWRRGRPLALWLELTVSLITSSLAGMIATALDFGGWNEPDPRAVAFAFFVSLAVLGLLRIFSLLRRSTDY